MVIMSTKHTYTYAHTKEDIFYHCYQVLMKVDKSTILTFVSELIPMRNLKTVKMTKVYNKVILSTTVTKNYSKSQ